MGVNGGAQRRGLFGGESPLQAAEQKLSQARRVQAEAELKAAQALEGRLELARLESAIAAARAAGVSESEGTMRAAEQKLDEVRERREAAAAARGGAPATRLAGFRAARCWTAAPPVAPVEPGRTAAGAAWSRRARRAPSRP